MSYAYGQCTWGVASRINQLGLKLKGRNGEKIPIISTMGNGQDWVRTAASLGGETGSTPKAGAIISFVGGRHGSAVGYGHVSFVEKFTQMVHSLFQKPMSMAIPITLSANYQDQIVQ